LSFNRFGICNDDNGFGILSDHEYLHEKTRHS
jgi:hypothetical protein